MNNDDFDRQFSALNKQFDTQFDKQFTTVKRVGIGLIVFTILFRLALAAGALYVLYLLIKILAHAAH